MTFEQAFERLDRLEKTLPQRITDAARVASLNLTASIVDRVVEAGEDATGQKFSPYSTRQMQAWRLWGKSATQAAEQRVKALARAKKTLSYAEFRQLNNRPIAFKTFSFTGVMWRGFGVVSAVSQGATVSVTIGGTNVYSRQKIQENSEQEGKNIVEPSQDELSRFKTDVLTLALRDV